MKSKSGALASQGQVCNLCRVTDLSAESEENTIVCCIQPLVGVGGASEALCSVKRARHTRAVVDCFCLEDILGTRRDSIRNQSGACLQLWKRSKGRKEDRKELWGEMKLCFLTWGSSLSDLPLAKSLRFQPI